MSDYNADLKNYFQNCEFNELQDIQNRAISNVVEKKENTLCIMPSGIERSIVYWLSAIKLGGICLVISPKNNLIKDQINKLTEYTEYNCNILEFTSSVSPEDQKNNLIKLANNEIDQCFIFASPERLVIDGFFEYCLKRRSKDIRLLVIDEAQYIFQWGNSFRPSLKKIPDFLNRIFEDEKHWCRILTLSGALNSADYNEICSTFNIDERNVIKDDILIRNEIQLHVKKYGNTDEKDDLLWNIIETHKDEKILVYVYKKHDENSVEELCEKANGKNYKTAFFHADMTSDKRNEVIENFKSGAINLLFTTDAFDSSSGINDIKDIRVVIHFTIPDSVDKYYQEVGCVAGDGKGANAYLLYSKNDFSNRISCIDKSFPEKETLIDTYKKIVIKTEYVVKRIKDLNEKNIKKCLPYYISCGAIKIAGKGFNNLIFLEDINDTDIKQYYDSTETKDYSKTLIENKLTPDELSNSVYAAIVDGKVTAAFPPERSIVLEVKTLELNADMLDSILNEIEERKTKRHDLLNVLQKLTKRNIILPQKIAEELGEDEYQRNRIYTTLDNNIVRSKSEVIISNLLHEAEIDYEYEKNLDCKEDGIICPDFTIHYGGKTYYWEHVGMLGKDGYSKDWLEKRRKYDKYYPGQLIITYESGVLSKDAKDLIDKIKNDEIKK